MANTNTLTDKLSAIGDSIRTKTGETSLLTLDDMPTAIESIETGGGSGGDTLIEQLQGISDGTVKNIEIDFPDAVYVPPQTLGYYQFGTYSAARRQRAVNITKFNVPKMEYLPLDFISGMGDGYPTTSDVRLVFPSVFYVHNSSSNSALGSKAKPIDICFPKPIYTYMNLFYMYCYIHTLYLATPNTTNMQFKLISDLASGSWGGIYNLCLHNTYTGTPGTIGSTSNGSGLWGYAYYAKTFILDYEVLPPLSTYICRYAHNNASNPFYNGQAKIYVPAALLPQCETATNWSIYYAVDAIKAIEDSKDELKGLYPEIDEKYGWSDE